MLPSNGLIVKYIMDNDCKKEKNNKNIINSINENNSKCRIIKYDNDIHAQPQRMIILKNLVTDMQTRNW